MMLLLKLISNEISYKALSKKCDQYKLLGMIQWIIADTLGFKSFEEAARKAPNTLGPKVADENMAYFVGVAEGCIVKKQGLKKTFGKLKDLNAKLDWVGNTFGSKMKSFVNMAKIEVTADDSFGEFQELSYTQAEFGTAGSFAIEDMDGDVVQHSVTFHAFLGDYETGHGMKNLLVAMWLIMHISFCFGLTLFPGDHKASTRYTMELTFKIFKESIDPRQPYTIIFAHVMPEKISDCMLAMRESGLANLNCQQAVRLLIWEKGRGQSNRGNSQLPYDVEYVVMGIHSADGIMPQDIYKGGWWDKETPGYPDTTIMHCPPIGTHSKDMESKIVNKTEINPWLSYKVNHNTPSQTSMNNSTSTKVSTL